MIGALALGLVVFAFGLGGAALSRAVLRGADTGADRGTKVFEAVTTAAVFALAAALCTSWLLAFVGKLDRAWLVGASLPWGLAGAPTLVRALRSGAGREYVVPRRWWGPLLALLLVLVWGGFALWRASIVPPYNHDALAYHLPRAAIFVQEGRFTLPATPEGRIASWPCNYELLFADGILLTGSDQVTGWLGPLSWATLLLFTILLAARFWGWGPHALIAAVLTAATPIAVLHTGLHKNDLLEAFLMIGTAYWLESWLKRGCVRALAVGVVTLLVALGTKLQGVFLVAVAGPVVLAGAIRHRQRLARPTHVLAACGLVLVLAAVLGGVVYATNLVRHHTVALPTDQKGGGYGAWSHIVVYPYLALAAPFSSHPGWVWVPWRSTYWWWPENDIWFSHFGEVFTFLVVAIPVVGWVWRKNGDNHARVFVLVFVLLVAALVLPVRVAPLGLVNGSGRYIFFVAPVIHAWAASPLYALAERTGPRGALAWVVVPLVGAYFVRSAWKFGVHDSACPVSWVEYVEQHPEDRRPAMRRNRAGFALDAMAGPTDHVAVDVSFDTWVYPAYGRRLTRRVSYLPRTDGPVPIPADVKWVMIDRTWNIFWAHPDFIDTSRMEFLGRGAPSKDDLKVARQLTRDPAWVLVYRDDAQNQAVFRRRDPPNEQQPAPAP